MRVNKRVSISLHPSVIARVRDRVAAARAAGRRSNFSRELARAVDEADGNHRRARHAVRDHLREIGRAVELLRRRVRLPDDAEALRAIAGAAASIGARLSPPPPPAA